jgi:TetR/AcrR family transcriptional repressor of bet genes
MGELAEPVRRRRGVPREDQVAGRRRQILEATVSVIGKSGLTGLTMKTIAAAAGCSYGVAAFHFRSKEGLLLAALDHLVEEYEQVRQPLSMGGEGPADAAAARLRAMIASDFDGRVSGDRQIAVWAAFWAETARNRAYRARCAELKERYRRSTAADVAMLAATRRLAVDADQVSATLNAIVDGFWIANLVSGQTGPAGREAGRQACLAYLKSVFPADF